MGVNHKNKYKANLRVKNLVKMAERLAANTDLTSKSRNFIISSRIKNLKGGAQAKAYYLVQPYMSVNTDVDANTE